MTAARNSDIVARLRDWASTICTVRNDEVPESKARLAREAADEIERLRAERDELVRRAEELTGERDGVTP